MAKVIIFDADWANLKSESRRNTAVPLETEEQLLQAIVFNLLWDYTNEKWIRPLADADGRQLVSTEATKTDSANHSSATIDDIGALVVDANADRKAVYIQNIGTVDVWLFYGSLGLATQGFLLAAGATLFEDIYFGEINGITETGTSELNILELS